MRIILEIAQREFRTRMFTKGSLISILAVVAFLAGGGSAIGYFFADDIRNSNTIKVALAQGNEELGQKLEQLIKGQEASGGADSGLAGGALGFNTELKSTTFDEEQLRQASAELDDQERQDIAAAVEKLADKQDLNAQVTEQLRGLAALVKDGQVDYGLTGTVQAPILVSDGTASSFMSLVVSGLAQSGALEGLLLDNDISSVEFGQYMAKAQALTLDIGASDSEGPSMTAYFSALIIVILLFMLIFPSGQMVAMGVVEEKSSRVVEILLATVRPSQLLWGKILGISAMALAQFVLYALAAGFGMWQAGFLEGLSLDLSALGLWSFVWLVLGLATALVIFAGLGATVDRVEDIGTALMPLILLQMAPVYAAIFGIQGDPGALWLRIVSCLPFANAYVMPVRQAVGQVPVLDLALSIGINLVFLPLATWFGARLYRGGLLHMGGRLSLSKALGLGREATQGAGV